MVLFTIGINVIVYAGPGLSPFCGKGSEYQADFVPIPA